MHQHVVFVGPVPNEELEGFALFVGVLEERGRVGFAFADDQSCSLDCQGQPDYIPNIQTSSHFLVCSCVADSDGHGSWSLQWVTSQCECVPATLCAWARD